jgi:hypothetical protein
VLAGHASGEMALDAVDGARPLLRYCHCDLVFRRLAFRLWLDPLSGGRSDNLQRRGWPDFQQLAGEVAPFMF